MFGIAITIATMLIIVVGSSFTAISLGISSSLKASSGGVVSTGNTGSSVSNLDGIHNPLSSNPLSSHLYFTRVLSSSAPGINAISNKVVMIGFDDSYKSQILYAKPILDKYGFKASFFEVCTWVGKTKDRQTWQDIADLQRDGMDVESHTMTHAHLPTLLSSPNLLVYEIGGSKQCLANHGVKATIFGYPLNLGSDNPSIVNVVAKYYNLARSGSAPLMFLNCKGYVKHSQNDCSTYSSNGKLTYANRYDIR
ncbi:MAG TPA: polysaccharide deacetylase family protein, partial [Bacteroidia bacterium]|nr:polysaccharide deacetylase family protein [Bacteroidia bacterium]